MIKSSLTYSQQRRRIKHLRSRICAALLPILPACSCCNAQIKKNDVKFIHLNPLGKSVFMDSYSNHSYKNMTVFPSYFVFHTEHKYNCLESLRVMIMGHNCFRNSTTVEYGKRLSLIQFQTIPRLTSVLSPCICFYDNSCVTDPREPLIKRTAMFRRSDHYLRLKI